MPSDDTRSSPVMGVSRRSVIRGAATAGAAGLAATALGGALSPAAAASTRPAAGTRSSAPASGAAKASAGPIVVHVRDAKSGDIEVFSGTSQTRLRDTDLAARIARAIG
jgi:nitrous oxide reductase